MLKELLQELDVEDAEHNRDEFFDFVKKIAKNPLVRSIAKKGLEYAPGVYHNLTKRVKNKRILNSDAAHLVLNKAIKTANNRLSNGLRLIKFSNWQIF